MTSPAEPPPGAAPRAADTWRRLDTLLVLLVTLHTIIVGSMLLFVPAWALAFGGWKGGTDILFFPRQGGAFHYVVAFGYLYEYFRHRGVVLMVAAKTIAFVFLMGATVLGGVPWAVSASGVLDGLMAVAVVLVHRRAARDARP